ncbi:MAG TPA: hypothetical protein VJN88_03965 [Ktedonobacterales bacterium]|nr:hypothetical protein [Ktedonobacterales bacterium]
MRVDAHQKRAQQLEHALSMLADPTSDADVVPAVIEMYWGAAFHWIAFGCQNKHRKHKENHIQLGRYLRDLGESRIAATWDRLELKRQGGMYAYMTAPADAAETRADWEEIRLWALS